ncbi:MAG: hypothetical protein RMJ75_07475 [Nitrososphaerota archaeon]|nr:hypothetical protein [Nitrososphaerota archaeon]
MRFRDRDGRGGARERSLLSILFVRFSSLSGARKGASSACFQSSS